MSRESSLLRIGLKGLGYVKFQRSEDNNALFACVEDDVELEEGRIILHFANHHNEVYKILKALIRSWALVGDSVLEVDDNNDDRCSCWCGKSYARWQGLYNHRRDKGHSKNIDLEERDIPIQA